MGMTEAKVCLPKTARRSFLRLSAASLSGAVLSADAPVAKPMLVPSHTDREGKARTVGVSKTTYKVLTAETAGAMFVMEQANSKKGGPNRHVHLSQDELFYVLEGQYIVEVGSERFHLGAGDCVLGPRQVPHAWAFVGDTPGRMLLSYSPAGKMEDFFNRREQLGIPKDSYSSGKNADILSAFGMKFVGPPLQI